MTRYLLAAVLASLSGLAFAQTVTVTKESGETEALEQQAQAEQTQDAKIEPDRNCLRNTGSRITISANRRAAKDGKAQSCANAFGRVYTQDDLDRSGHINIADALRSLDTRIR